MIEPSTFSAESSFAGFGRRQRGGINVLRMATMAAAWTCEASVGAHEEGERGALLHQFDRHRSTKAVLTCSKRSRKNPGPLWRSCCYY